MLESLKKFFNKGRNTGSESKAASAANNSKPTSAFSRQSQAKSSIFASGDQLEALRQAAAETNAIAEKLNKEALYISATVYVYDPRPLKGVKPGQVIMTRKSRVKKIVGPNSTWEADAWPEDVALTYRGKPFGVVVSKKVEGITDIPVLVGELLEGYHNIPDTRLHIKNENPDFYPITDLAKYDALNAKPAGREFRADYKVNLVGEEKVQAELAELGEGYIWLSVSLGTFDQGEHAGETSVEFALAGKPCGHLTPLQSSRYQAMVPKGGTAICLAKIEQGKKKLEIKALLPAWKDVNEA